MKKTVKSLIIAASVAAIAGIGAVSFAKWEAGKTHTENLAGTATGKIEAIGSFTATSSLDVSESLKLKLMPYDQVAQLDNYDATDNAAGTTATLWTITIDETDLETGAYTFTYTIAYNEATTNDLGENKLHVCTGTYADATESTIGDGKLWKPLSKTAQTVTPDANGKIYIILVSDNTAAGENQYSTADMEKNFGVTITATGANK